MRIARQPLADGTVQTRVQGFVAPTPLAQHACRGAAEEPRVAFREVPPVTLQAGTHGPREALNQIIESLHLLLQSHARMCELQATADGIQARVRHPKLAPHAGSQPTRSGTTSSAAADGVGARASATKSAMVKSISCPTPQTTGSRQAWIARARRSSLNAHRSSSEPPPRAKISTSHSARAEALSRAATSAGTAAAPCTAVWYRSTSAGG